MASYNRVILLGNLTRDPQIRYLPSGMAVCDIGLAVNDPARTPMGSGWTKRLLSTLRFGNGLRKSPASTLARALPC